MAYLVLVIDVPNDTIASLNSNTQFPTNVEQSLNGCLNVLAAVNGGNKVGSVQVTTTSTAPTVTPTGTGSQQNTYSNL